MKLRFLVLFVPIVAYLILVHFRGISLHDEGLIVNSAARIVRGDAPYSDFQFFYTPGSIFTMALAFKIFGESFFVGRVVALIFSLVSAYLAFNLAKSISRKFYVGAVSSVIFTIWGASVINFLWPVMGCVTFVLANLWFLKKFRNGRGEHYIVAGGLAAAAVFLFKQNFGVAVFAANIAGLFILYRRESLRLVLKYVASFMLPVALFVVYLSINGSLSAFFYDMYYGTVIKTKDLLTTPFIYPGPWYLISPKVLFYLSPLLLGVAGIYLSYKNKMKFLLLTLLPPAFYIAGIRPTADLVHLAPLLILSVVPLAAISRFYSRAAAVLLGMIIVFLGFVNVFFGGYYKSETPYLAQSVYANNPMVEIFIDQKNYTRLERIVPILRAEDNDYVFIYHDSAPLYLFSGKLNPTRYDRLPPEIMTPSFQTQLIENLETKNVDLVVSDADINQEEGVLSEYITNNFTLYEEVEGYQIWYKKGTKSYFSISR